ncbi:hypothetical protein SASPL_108229 [Salvia splendens]|uniref:Uncharacterized protein n=1 Tax=Salvia splendens TaxID=180675 RepID=A0A8X9A612_SALSN|nr:hypothetical protein SASPL_108229 [Salvia splendens]
MTIDCQENGPGRAASGDDVTDEKEKRKSAQKLLPQTLTGLRTGSVIPDSGPGLSPPHDKVEYVLDKPISVIPNKESLEFATFDVEVHQKHIDNASDTQCVMLSSMNLELQRQHEHMFLYEMLKHLESLYASQAQTMEYEILRDLFKCKLHDGGKVS